MCRDGARSGHSLVELVVAMLVLAALGSGAVGLLTVELRLVRESAAAAEAGNAVRFAARLLRSELRPLVAGRDVRGLGPDSSSQRVFRGLGIVCALSGPSVQLRYRGIRDPDPAKDSLLVLAAAAERTAAVTAVGTPASPGCSPGAGESLLELSAAGSLGPDDVVLIFESGTWHLAASALRYERGAGGRQPVTPAVLVDDSTSMTADTVAGESVAIGLLLAAFPSGSPRRYGMLRQSYRIALLNLRLPLDSAVFPP